MPEAMIARIARLYPFMSGNFTLVNYSRFSRLFPASPRLAWCPSPGGPILVPLNDAVGRCIYFTGDYDRKITWLCRKILKPGDIALDIGANLGVVTLAMARAVGPVGHVHSFEPNPILYPILDQSISRSTGNITLHKFALGSRSREMFLSVPGENIGAASLARLSGATTVKCEVRKLDDIVTTRVRLIKLDVEGFENEVLIGANRVLTSMFPFIILETNEHLNRPFKTYPAIRTLLDVGYRIFGIPKAMFSMKLFRADMDDLYPPSHDVLAVHKSSEIPKGMLI
jgi:FkbM family methyltransferase